MDIAGILLTLLIAILVIWSVIAIPLTLVRMHAGKTTCTPWTKSRIDNDNLVRRYKFDYYFKNADASNPDWDIDLWNRCNREDLWQHDYKDRPKVGDYPVFRKRF